MQIFDCFIPSHLIRNNNRRNSGTNGSYSPRSSESNIRKATISPSTITPPFSNSQLIDLANSAPHQLEYLIKKKLVSIDRAKHVLIPSFSGGTSILLKLLETDPSHIERLLKCKVLPLSEIYNDKHFSETLFGNNPNILGELLQEKIINQYDLPNIKCRSGSSILHFLARQKPKELTKLIQRQKLDPTFISFVNHDTRIYRLSKLEGEGTVIGTLVKYNQEEFIKWILEYSWITLADCKKKNTLIERQLNWVDNEYISIAEFYERKYKIRFESFLEQKKEALIKQKSKLGEIIERTTTF